MILASCVVVVESKCLDIPVWEFSVIVESCEVGNKLSRALVSLSLDTVEDVMVGEVDELEEDVG